ncbi:hypothetical protein CC1G_12009 [Coprinopsis cinerea okayama7|uniref:HCP-like protein n=1 Tax=Coprinopsis cinerea (strain Okayama-7 / 130 / ATCC MYA-4618 / FGSC 9003) TaxID=240176 RepID=A8N104_COPC7|nr:hypothetical protein CC1G_12009 [Coprinopsis cinerea okayama7\|eukprot:XP_001828561.2 hypothetical protein CC1G_12009 [Coprinopsis cinerea okayama7\
MSQRYRESPLATLVRRTSSRRAKAPPRLQQSETEPHPPQSHHYQQPTPPTITLQGAEDVHYTPQYASPAAFQGQQQQWDNQPPLPSPLLHGRFARDSVATASSYEGNSYLDTSSNGSTSRTHSFSSSNVNAYPDGEGDDGYGHGYQYHYDDAYEQSAYEESIYSQPDTITRISAALRDSWTSTATADPNGVAGGAALDMKMGTGYREFGNANIHQSDSDAVSIVPSLVAESSDPSTPTSSTTTPAGRAKIVHPVTSGNYSRPMGRPPPPPLQGLEEQKRQVLLRNAGRHRSEERKAEKGPSPLRNQYGSGGGGDSVTSAGGQTPTAPESRSIGDGGRLYNAAASSSQPSLTNGMNGSGRQDHQQQNQGYLPTPPSMTASSRSPSSSSLSPNPTTSTAATSTLGSSEPHDRYADTLPNPYSNPHSNPHSKSNSSLDPRAYHQQPPASPVSLYSNYSYYPFEGAVPSPTGSTFSNSKDPFAAPGKASQQPSSLQASSTQQSNQFLAPPSSHHNPSSSSPSSPSGPKSAHDYLLLGIEHHEHDRLKESATCFEKSAKEGGGCGVGMLMWGLTLRHGWGCEKNEKVAFKWLQKAAESAVGDLEATRASGVKDVSVVRNELVLAIYEVGQCFFQGWGVPKDQKMAVSYYTIAAELGDADAQMDLAFCLTNGKGCKKNKKEAAKWYRAAVKQGQSDVGLAWIYKEKYQ